MPMNRTLSKLHSYGRGFVCFPVLIRGTGGPPGEEVEIVSGPPGAQVELGAASTYNVLLPGEGRFSHITVTGQGTTANGNIVVVDNVSLSPADRVFSFQLAAYGGARVVFELGQDELVSLIVIVENKGEA